MDLFLLNGVSWLVVRVPNLNVKIKLFTLLKILLIDMLKKNTDKQKSFLKLLFNTDFEYAEPKNSDNIFRLIEIGIKT
jgi:hypothetical protein